jgi:putative mycofactocin binding protein MftB
VSTESSAGVVTAAAPAATLSARSLALHPQVALRPEPFGALAYHYDTRRLVFLKHPDIVNVVRALADHPTVGDALAACGIDPSRYPAFERALSALIDSEMLHDRAG